MEPAEDGKWSRATFRVWSEHVTLEEIQKRLGLIPTSVSRKGEATSLIRITVQKFHVFMIESAVHKSEKLDRHLASLCDLLEPAAAKIAALPSTCERDLFCGFSSGSGQGGFTLPPVLLQRLAALDVPLAIDLYPWSEID